MLAFLQGEDYDAAIVHAERMVGVIEGSLGIGHPAAATSLDLLGHTYGVAGRTQDAADTYARIVSILEEAAPDGTPRLGWVLYKCAEAATATNQIGAAIDYSRRAEVMLTRFRGASHPDTLRGPTFVLMVAEFNLRNDEAAGERLERMRAGALPYPFQRVFTELVAAGLAARRGDEAAALAGLEAARAVFSVEDGSPYESEPFLHVMHPMWQAVIHLELGQPERAVEPALRALEGQETHGGGPPFQRVEVAAVAALAHHEAGDAKAARPLLETAISEVDEAGFDMPNWYAVDARFALAQTVAEEDPERATELATRAIAEYEELGSGFHDRRAAAQAWLSAR